MKLSDLLSQVGPDENLALMWDRAEGAVLITHTSLAVVYPGGPALVG